jgi:hypothetical protein
MGISTGKMVKVRSIPPLIFPKPDVQQRGRSAQLSPVRGHLEARSWNRGAASTACRADAQGALSLIALAHSHRANLPEWMQNWRIFTDLPSELEQELEPESLQTTWTTGMALDLSQTVQFLHTEFAGDMSDKNSSG